MSQPVIPTPPCPKCGGPTTWYGQYGRWGCDRCQLYLDAQPVIQQAPAPQPQPPRAVPAKPSAGARVASILLTIVLIVVIAAVKIGCRRMFR